MKYIVLLITMLIFMVSCGDKPAETTEATETQPQPSAKVDTFPSGSWRGDITDGGKKHKIQIDLEKETGTFAVLTKTGKDFDIGEKAKIIKIKYENNELSFMALISGEEDEDSLNFKLTHKDGKLVGIGKQNRDDANTDKSITLTKHK